MANGPHQILNSSNAPLSVTNLVSAGPTAVSVISEIPLTTHDGSATGQIVVPVSVVGGGAGGATQVEGVDAAGGTTSSNPIQLAGLSGTTVVALVATSAGALSVIPTLAKTTTAALSNVNYSGSNQTVVASNASRIGLMLFNDTDGSLFLKYGSGSSSSSFTVKVAAGGYWEMPQPIFTGILTGTGTGGSTGATRVTELT